jgi:hypothetical protein
MKLETKQLTYQMTTPRTTTVTAALLVVVFALAGTDALAIEQPEYEILETIGDLEIRKYQPHNIARTLVSGEFTEVANGGFRRLAGYIFGSNQAEQKIAMTAPVAQIPTEAGDYWLTFSMPTEHDFKELPDPADSRVELLQVPAKTIAVLAYRGSWSEKRYRKHEQAMQQTLESSGDWEVIGLPSWFRYDPPVMPWFLRRNEVAVEVIATTPVNE